MLKLLPPLIPSLRVVSFSPDKRLPAVQQTASRVPAGSKAGSQPRRAPSDGSDAGCRKDRRLDHAGHLPPVAGGAPGPAPAAAGAQQRQMT